MVDFDTYIFHRVVGLIRKIAIVKLLHVCLFFVFEGIGVRNVCHCQHLYFVPTTNLISTQLPETSSFIL